MQYHYLSSLHLQSSSAGENNTWPESFSSILNISHWRSFMYTRNDFVRCRFSVLSIFWNTSLELTKTIVVCTITRPVVHKTYRDVKTFFIRTVPFMSSGLTAKLWPNSLLKVDRNIQNLWIIDCQAQATTHICRQRSLDYLHLPRLPTTCNCIYNTHASSAAPITYLCTNNYYMCMRSTFWAATPSVFMNNHIF